jgi:hypothetical protein
MNLGKLILVLREVLDWTIILFLSLFVLDMANPAMAWSLRSYQIRNQHFLG